MWSIFNGILRATDDLQRLDLGNLQLKFAGEVQLHIHNSGMEEAGTGHGCCGSRWVTLLFIPIPTLALMREACKSVGIGTSGGKERHYRRLTEFDKEHDGGSCA